MSATDPPVVNLRKAFKKLVPVQRNLLQAWRDDLAEQVIALKEDVAAAVEALGGWKEDGPASGT